MKLLLVITADMVHRIRFLPNCIANAETGNISDLVWALATCVVPEVD